MSDRIRIIKHEAVPRCGSFEVWFPDGRPSQYFYWDDLPSRRLRSDALDRETARARAKEFARAARGTDGGCARYESAPEMPNLVRLDDGPSYFHPATV